MLKVIRVSQPLQEFRENVFSAVFVFVGLRFHGPLDDPRYLYPFSRHAQK